MKLKNLGLIVAHSQNMAIGINGSMPWRLSEDLKHFKKVTLSNKIIMGRKTYESIGSKPLVKRENIVLTSKKINSGNITIYNDFDVLLDKIKNDFDKKYFVIGGEKVYKQFIPYCSFFYISLVEGSFKADTFFPKVNLSGFKKETIKEVKVDDNNSASYKIIRYY